VCKSEWTRWRRPALQVGRHRPMEKQRNGDCVCLSPETGTLSSSCPWTSEPQAPSFWAPGLSLPPLGSQVFGLWLLVSIITRATSPKTFPLIYLVTTHPVASVFPRALTSGVPPFHKTPLQVRVSSPQDVSIQVPHTPCLSFHDHSASGLHMMSGNSFRAGIALICKQTHPSGVIFV
jgi:hypothetical protein